jgi:hypothetical protein
MEVVMNTRFTSAIKKIVITASVLFFGVNTAQATTINFDDLTYVPDPDFPCFCDNPLTDQYQSKGLLIDGGFLVPVDPSGNGLLGSNFLQLNFIGSFPTFVSMYVSAPNEDVIYLDARGASGSVVHKQTTGWGGPFDDTPYVPNQLISFNLLDGCTSITLQGFYDLRVEALVDNLTFTYASDVPEPSSLLLLSIGLAGCLLLRSRVRDST